MIKSKYLEAAEGKASEKERSDSGKLRQNNWTVMVYLGGDNNLAEEMVFALKCMELVGSKPPVYEVFALYDGGVSPVPFEIGKRRTGSSHLLRRAERTRKDEADANVKVAKVELEEANSHLIQVKATAKKMLPETSALQSPGKYAKKPTLASFESQPATSTLVEIQKKAEEQVEAAEQNLEAVVKAETDGPDSADPVQSVLAKFVVDTISQHPAEKYMLILSGHGSGAVGDFLTSNSRFSGLSIPDLRDALDDIQNFFSGKTFAASDGKCRPYFANGKIDILGMDSCLMGMAEVAFEVRGYVDYLIGTEGFEPNTGWPYDEVLTLLTENPGPKNLARNIVNRYISYYSSDYTLAEVSTDQTALDLTEVGKGKSRIDKFADAVGGLNGLSVHLINGLENPDTFVKTRDAVVMAHWRAQGYKNEQHVDVYDFCVLLQESFEKNHPISRACERVKLSIEGEEGLVVRSSYCGPAFQHSHGVSIFFPWANITDAVGVSEVDQYRGLAFARNHNWDEFLISYHRSTQREIRNDARGLITHESMLNRRPGIFTGPAPEDNKAGGANSGFKAGGANSGFKAGGANSGFKAGGANSGFKAGGANSGFKAGGANSGFKMSSGGITIDSLPKIASMKNPAIKWKELRRDSE